MRGKRPEELENRVLLLPPTARDAVLTQNLLGGAGVHCDICATIDEVCGEIGREAGAALVTAEAILGDKKGQLAHLLKGQAPWSDFPLIVLTAPGAEVPGILGALEAIGPMTFMKRPVQVSTLVSTVLFALRDRRRQYAVRSHLAEHARQAEALVAAEERLRLMVESVQDYAIFSMDVDGRVASWNAGATSVFGWPEQEIIGQNAAVLFIPEDRAAGVPQRELIRAREIGRSENERWNLRKDGSRFFASGVVTAIRGSAGVLRGFTQVCRDVTDQKRTEEALREAGQRKDEFLAMLAHELRNPLAPIRNSLQIMRLAGGDRTVFDQSRAMMERQVGHMVRLIDDLLDVSRVSRGKVELRKECVDLAAVVTAAVETSHPAIEAQGHHFTLNLPESPVYLEADPTRLAQVIANLLNNAAKFTKPGGHIWLTAERQGNEAVLRVRDTGDGIPADMLPKVFDLFTQLDRTPERSQSGLGIGLTLVKSLVEMHGGMVEAASAGQERGSEFIVRLPILTEALGGKVGDRKAGSSYSSRTTPRRILVVDDNRDAANSLSQLLTLLGHDVRAVHNGPAALAAVEEHDPEVVFLDLGMPAMSGYEVATRLRSRSKGSAIHLVAVTGWGSEGDRRRTNETGFDFHLVKPVAPMELQEFLEKVESKAPKG